MSFDVVISNAFEEERSMAVPKEKRQASTAGQAIKTYRQAHGITQKQLAIELGVEARTLRMYENGERALDNITDLQRIADLLAIDPEMLGLSPKSMIPILPHRSMKSSNEYGPSFLRLASLKHLQALIPCCKM